MTLEQEALGTSAQVCQITAALQDGQSFPAGRIWASGIHQFTLPKRKRNTLPEEKTDHTHTEFLSL